MCVMDHRGLDKTNEALSAAVSSHDVLETVHATAAFKFHLDIHLAKEDAHLCRLVRERVSAPELTKAITIISSHTPRERFPEVVAWRFPLMGDDDRENMTLAWQMVMPPPMFAQVKPLIQKAVGNDWTELTRRIPTLG